MTGSWEIDFESLGYEEEELRNRLRDGFILLHVSSVVCLLAVAAYLIRTINGVQKSESLDSDDGKGHQERGSRAHRPARLHEELSAPTGPGGTREVAGGNEPVRSRPLDEQ